MTPQRRKTDDDQSLKVKSKWLQVDFRGSTQALVACLGCALICAIVWKSSAWADTRHQEVLQAIKLSGEEQAAAIRESNAANIWLSTATPEERAALRPNMPASLRAMQGKKQ